MHQTTQHFMILDLGATKCAGALVAHTPPTDFNIIRQHTVKLATYHSLGEMIDELEQELQIDKHDIDGICIAAAGVYDGKELILEKGYPYPMSFAAIAKLKHWPPFVVVHDYTPIICRSFVASQHGLLTILPGVMNPHGRRVAFGLGTGLGLKDATLTANQQLWLGVNEIGHIGITMPPNVESHTYERHKTFMEFLYRHKDHYSSGITFESILSGPGLARIFQFTHQLDHPLTPEQSAIAIAQEQDTETLACFAFYLGLFISSVQLIFMPSGGIWISGGVINKHLSLFIEPLLSVIHEGIHTAPAYLSQREQFPLHVLTGSDHAFLGGAYYLAQWFANNIM